MKTQKIHKTLDVCKRTIANLDNQDEVRGGMFDTYECMTDPCPTYSEACIICPPNAPC